MKQVIAAAFSAAILFTPSVVAAEEVGQYFGAGVAQVKLLDWCDSAGGVTIESCEDSEIGYQGFGGVRVDEHIGLEGGIMFASGFDGTASEGGTSASIDADLLVLYGTVNGYLPLGDHFSLMGKAGAHWWNLSASGSGGFASDDGIHALFGAGAEFKPTDNFALRAEWTRFLTSESDFDAPSVNLVVTF